MKETVKGGTVGTLVKDLFWNIPLTGRAIDPSAVSTLEKQKKNQQDSEKKYKFSVEGIDTPERPSDDPQTPQTPQPQSGLTTPKSPPGGVPMFGPLPPVPTPPPSLASTQVSVQGDVTDSSEYMEIAMRSNQSLYSKDSETSPESNGTSAVDHSEGISSLRRMEKKGFSYIDRNLAQDIVKRAGDLTSRKPHESIEENAKKRERENKSESVLIMEAKSKLQKESVREDRKVKDVQEPVSPEATLMAAKSKLQKQNSTDKNSSTSYVNREKTTQKSFIESSMLLNAKSRLKSTSKVDTQENGATNTQIVDNRATTATKTESIGAVLNQNKPNLKPARDIPSKTTERETLRDENKNLITKPGTVEYQTTVTKVESQSSVKNVSAKYGGDEGGNTRQSATGGVVKKIDTTAQVSAKTGKFQQTNNNISNQKKFSGQVSEKSTDIKYKSPIVADRSVQNTEVKRGDIVQSTVTVAEKRTQDATVGSGSMSPDFHSPKSIDPPDSAYYSDSKVSPNFEYKNEYKKITEEFEKIDTTTVAQKQDVTLGYAMNEGGLNKTDISKYIIKPDHTKKPVESTNITAAAAVATTSQTSTQRYDADDQTKHMVEVTRTDTNMSDRSKKSSKSDPKQGIRSLREVKKAAQRMKAVDIEYDLQEPLRVSQRDLRNASLSKSVQSHDDDDDDQVDNVAHTVITATRDDENHSTLTRDENTHMKVNNTHTEVNNTHREVNNAHKNFKNDRSREVNVHSRREVNEDNNHINGDIHREVNIDYSREVNIDKSRRNKDAPRSRSSSSESSSDSEAPTPTPARDNIYIEIPVRGMSGDRVEMGTRVRVETGGRDRRVRADSESDASFVSSTGHYRGVARDVPITVHGHYDGPSQRYPMYSPGASSTQTEHTYSSVSVPMLSPSISEASSMSTTAQDTFEYSRAHRQRQPQRPARSARNTTDRNPLHQPLTININPEPRGRQRTASRPAGGRSRSETRITRTAHHNSYNNVAAPVMNHEHGMFRMSQMSDHEMSSSRHGQRQPAALRPRQVRTDTHQQPGSYGQPLSPSYRDPDYRMRPREESFNSQSSGPLSPPGRYLRVDEHRGGRVPIYGRRGRSIRDVEGHEYTQSSSTHHSSSRRTQGHVSRVHVDEPYDPHGDANSALSEPVYAAASGKYSVHRQMEKRGIHGGSQQQIHPDMQNQSRKRRVYQVASGGGGGSSTLNTVRTLNSTTSGPRIRSPDVAGVDPELEDVGMQGDKYQVTLKLNAMGNNSSRPGSRLDEYHEEHTNSLQNHAAASRYETQYDADQTTYTYRDRAHRSHSHGQYDREMSPNMDTARRQVTLVKLKDPAVIDGNVQGQHSTTARFKVRHDAPEIAIHGQTVDRDREYMIKSVTGTDRQYADSSLSPNRGSEAPRFTMTVNQTMTMDYVAPTDEEGEEPIQPARTSGPERPPRRKKNKNRQDQEDGVDWFRAVTVEDAFERNASSRQTPVDETHLLATSAPSNDEGRQRRKGRRKMNEDDLENYLSPAEEQDNGTHSGQMPQVVRGSILIKNAIDTTGAPRVIDVVEGDDSDDEVMVDDNVNMFHGSYFQSRENPMYSSDPDLSGIKSNTRRRSQQPAFTQIFDGSEKYREIKVNRDPGKRHKVTERTQRSEHVNGYDEVDARARMTREERTEYEIHRLLKGAPEGSIKQTINVEREEEDILGPLPSNHADGSRAKPEDMLNFDTVSEKVDMGLRDGKAEVTVKVRCERIVPIRGVEDMFKKSSVIVTRLIEIDLFATEERRHLWENIVKRTNQGAITDGSGSRDLMRGSKLSTKDTFNLYKTFMGLAEADEAGKNREHMRIDRQVEEERRPDLYAGPDGRMMDDQIDIAGGFDTDELDKKLEDNLVHNYKAKKVEADTMSFVSAASETHDMLY